MTGFRVSIIIPVFNGADYLREAIDSALAQDYADYEVIVVNDGSADEGASERIARAYGERIRYFSKPNGGVASALNLAIEHMSGNYFSWLSHDDLYMPDKLSRQVECIRRLGRSDVVIYSDYAVFSNEPEQAAPVRLPSVPSRDFRFWITVENRLHGCTLLIPRAAFAAVGTFDPALRTTQDYDLWFRMAQRFDFIHLPQVLVRARSHAEQGSLKMQGIARVECNNLLTGFVEQLSSAEVSAHGSRSLGQGYALIAQSMFARGFDLAGKRAQQMAQKHGYRTDRLARLLDVRNVAGPWLKSRVGRVARRVLPARVKRWIRRYLPVSPLQLQPLRLQEKFTRIYQHNIFGGRVSRSGEGSDLVQTAEIRRQLPELLRQLNVRSLLDAPCGDWCWMSQTTLELERYVGVDIVAPLIEKNRERYARPGVEFDCVDLAVDPLPCVDVIFSRDCLVHLSFEDALRVLANFKASGSTYLLLTTFTERTANNDLVGDDAFWRPLNMQLPPFSFPAPLQLINEQCSEEGGLFADKSLALWRLADIRI